jgi:hypothetical protein
MAFRANEEIEKGLNRALAKLVPREASAEDRKKCVAKIHELIEQHGPVVEAYPYWHPMVVSPDSSKVYSRRPEKDNGYAGLDHTIFLRNALITCPYDGGKEILKSVETRPFKHVRLQAEEIDAPLYHPSATPILVYLDWEDAGLPLDSAGFIPLKVAAPLFIERHIRGWKSAQIAENWKDMNLYILGQPNGGRSSLFVNQKTGQALKKLFDMMNETGMFGPLNME